MNVEHKFTALLLQSKVFSEHDELLTVFTLEKGRLHLLAKGVRKPTSRLRAGLVVPSLAEIRVVDASIDRVIGAKTIEFLDLANVSLAERALWYWVVEVSLKGVPEHVTSRENFTLLSQIWQLLRQKQIQSSNQAYGVAVWFTLHWMRLAGFKVVLPRQDDFCAVDANIGGFAVATDPLFSDITPEICGLLRRLENVSASHDMLNFTNLPLEMLRSSFLAMAKLLSETLQCQWKSLSVWTEGI